MQAILTLDSPKSVKELQSFLGMVQYYRDMWAKHSEMLAPLTDLVGECGQTKATKKNDAKKKPWKWKSIHQQTFDNIKAAVAKRSSPGLPRLYQAFWDIHWCLHNAVGSSDNSGKQAYSILQQETFQNTIQIQCYQNQTSSHSRNLKGVLRNAVGANNKSLYRP